MMKNQIVNISTFLSLVALFSFAQPPENMPPLQLDQMTEEERRLFTTQPSAPEAQQNLNQTAPVEVPAVEVIEVAPSEPVAESQNMVENIQPAQQDLSSQVPVEQPEAVQKIEKEDGTLNNLVADFGISVFPIGYDRINITAEGHYFFQIAPSVNLSTKLKSSKGLVTSFSLGYEGIWREFFNKTIAGRRDFEHDIYAAVDHQWNDMVSTTVDTLFVYYLVNGTDAAGDGAIVTYVGPTVNFKFADNVKTGLRYRGKYVSVLNSSLDSGDIDFDEGGVGFAAVPSLSSPATALPGDGNRSYWMEHWLGVNGKYSPVKGTDLALGYDYVFLVTANQTTSKWKGHYIFPSIAQKMPWDGGKVKLTYEVRIRNYDNRPVAGTTVNKTDFRNRFTLDVSQKINDSMTFLARYRLQLYGANETDYEFQNASWFYTGVNFGF